MADKDKNVSQTYIPYLSNESKKFLALLFCRGGYCDSVYEALRMAFHFTFSVGLVRSLGQIRGISFIPSYLYCTSKECELIRRYKKVLTGSSFLCFILSNTSNVSWLHSLASVIHHSSNNEIWLKMYYLWVFHRSEPIKALALSCWLSLWLKYLMYVNTTIPIIHHLWKITSNSNFCFIAFLVESVSEKY